MMTPADKGLLRHIAWYCEHDDDNGIVMVTTLIHLGGASVITPIHGRMSYEDWLVLTDRITRFFLVLHGSHMFPGVR